MSREEYFGSGRTHRIVPPSQQSHMKKKLSDPVKFEDESNMRPMSMDKRIDQSLSTIFGNSNVIDF